MNTEKKKDRELAEILIAISIVAKRLACQLMKGGSTNGKSVRPAL